LLNPPPRVQLLFNVTRMHKIFEIISRNEAKES
jgi:anti-anti-sigma regulatory factor